MKPSPTRGEAYVICPICYAAGLDEPDAIASLDTDATERGRYRYLDTFECPRGHSDSDLSDQQKGELFEEATEWVADAIDALEDAANDAAHDRRNWE